MGHLRRLFAGWCAAYDRAAWWWIVLYVGLGVWNAYLGAWWVASFMAFLVGVLLGRKTTAVPAAQPSTAEAMASLMDQVQQLEEAARGYRATLERQGWSPTVAEYMAMQLHAGLVTSAFTPRKGR